jgi:hypothetical protein
MCISNKNKVSPSKPEATSKQNQTLADSFTSASIAVPTFRDVPHREVHVASLSSSKLNALKSEDPFMYYSIPNVRNAELNGSLVDAASLAAKVTAECKSATISRQQRLTTECHPDMMYKDLGDCTADIEKAREEARRLVMLAEVEDDDENEEEAEDGFFYDYVALLKKSFQSN